MRILKLREPLLSTRGLRIGGQQVWSAVVQCSLGLLSAAFGLQGDQLSLDCFFAIVFFFSYQFKGPLHASGARLCLRLALLQCSGPEVRETHLPGPQPGRCGACRLGEGPVKGFPGRPRQLGLGGCCRGGWSACRPGRKAGRGRGVCSARRQLAWNLGPVVGPEIHSPPDPSCGTLSGS